MPKVGPISRRISSSFCDDWDSKDQGQARSTSSWYAAEVLCDCQIPMKAISP
jgi:hypothetical protein